MEQSKIESAKEIIREAMLKGQRPVVLFSGGKDSTVVLHLVRELYPEIPAMFNNTGVEARETILYVTSIKNVLENKPEKTFWQCCKEYGFPTTKASNKKRHGNMCCKILKEDPGDERIKKERFDVVFTGLTAEESRQRRLTFIRMAKKQTSGLYKLKSGEWRAHPIWDWTEEDVWEFIRENKIKYNVGYDSGWKRCGCMPCTAHKNWMERLAKENPKLLKIVLKKRYGQRQCGDFFTFGEDIKIEKH